MAAPERPPKDAELSDTMSIGAEAVAANAEMADIPRGTSFGRYVVLSRLGAGGMGVVYAAYDPELDRKVALKLLRVQAQGASAGENTALRLMREAQAMARLSHPNVLAVYDVGAHEGQLFMAIEMVEGGTLRDWLAEQPRRWREVVAMFKAAGRGLAAAHAVGIVHRDFKPANVLVGQDGRPRVTDFGIARAAGEPTSAGVTQAPIDDVIVRHDALGTPLTQAGTALGTPGYMAPEQYDGQPTDARSDQYGFCVALYEALYREPPFEGSLRRVAAQVTSGKTPRPPKGRRVPAWVRRIVLTGLRKDPAERYPTMDALLDDLDRDRTALRWRWLAGTGALCLLGAVAAGYWQVGERRSLMCKGAERKLVHVWDEEQKRAVARAFRATGKPYAQDTWTRVERALDTYTTQWVAMHAEACEATRLRGEQPEETLSLRMGCLAERLGEVGALVGLFTAADATLVQNAVKAAHSMRPVADCADLVALRSPVKLPADPATRAKVDEVRASLAGVRARSDAGKYKEGLELAAPIVKAARAIGYAPLIAESLLLAGDLAHDSGDFRAGERDLTEAVLVAEESRHDAVAAEAATSLLYQVGYTEERFKEGDVLARYARALVNRAGGGGTLDVRLVRSMMAMEIARRNFPAAVTFAEQAVAIVDKAPKEHAIRRGSAHQNLALALAGTGRHAEAIEQYQQAIAIEERELGEGHPKLALAHGNLAETYWAMGRYQEARPHVEQALALARQELGVEHDTTAWLMHILGTVLAGQGHLQQAGAHIEQALAINGKLYGPDHSWVARTCTDLGHVRRRQGRLDEARALYARALAIEEKSLGQEVADLVGPLYGMGWIALARGSPRAALPLLERALRIAERGMDYRMTEAELRFTLARALGEAGRDRPRAVDLAKKARTIYVEAGADDRDKATAEIDAWLAAGRNPP